MAFASLNHFGEATKPSWLVRYNGKRVMGPERLMRAVRLSTISTWLVGARIGLAAMLISGSASTASVPALIASDVSGVPSWNLMFGRSLTVHEVYAAFGVIDSARYGLTSPVLSRSASGSKTAPPIMYAETANRFVVGLSPSVSASRPYRSVPPRLGGPFGPAPSVVAPGLALLVSLLLEHEAATSIRPIATTTVMRPSRPRRFMRPPLALDDP